MKSDPEKEKSRALKIRELNQLLGLEYAYRDERYASVLDENGNINKTATNAVAKVHNNAAKAKAEIIKDENFKYNSAMEQNKAIREDVEDIKDILAEKQSQKKSVVTSASGPESEPEPKRKYQNKPMARIVDMSNKPRKQGVNKTSSNLEPMMYNSRNVVKKTTKPNYDGKEFNSAEDAVLQFMEFKNSKSKYDGWRRTPPGKLTKDNPYISFKVKNEYADFTPNEFNEVKQYIQKIRNIHTNHFGMWLFQIIKYDKDVISSEDLKRDYPDNYEGWGRTEEEFAEAQSREWVERTFEKARKRRELEAKEQDEAFAQFEKDNVDPTWSPEGEEYNGRQQEATMDRLQMNKLDIVLLGSTIAKKISEVVDLIDITPRDFFYIIWESRQDVNPEGRKALEAFIASTDEIEGAGKKQKNRRGKSHNSMCIYQDGTLGKLKFNMGELLFNNFASCTDQDGNVVLNEAVSPHITGFLTTMHSTKYKDISKEDRDQIRKIVVKADIIPNKNNSKFKLIAEDHEPLLIPKKATKKFLKEKFNELVGIYAQGNGEPGSNIHDNLLRIIKELEERDTKPSEITMMKRKMMGGQRFFF